MSDGGESDDETCAIREMMVIKANEGMMKGGDGGKKGRPQDRADEQNGTRREMDADDGGVGGRGVACKGDKKGEGGGDKKKATGGRKARQQGGAAAAA